jgi:hypothetical protein
MDFLTRGHMLADVSAIIGSLDIVFGEISHPVEGGDSSLSVGVSAETLQELAPADYLDARGRAAFNRSRLRIDARAQALTALLRHSLNRGVMETLEAENARACRLFATPTTKR